MSASELRNSRETWTPVTITTPNGTYQGVVVAMRPESGDGSTGHWLVQLDTMSREVYVRVNHH